MLWQGTGPRSIRDDIGRPASRITAGCGKINACNSAGLSVLVWLPLSCFFFLALVSKLQFSKESRGNQVIDFREAHFKTGFKYEVHGRASAGGIEMHPPQSPTYQF
jgi:hypothetical protein